MVFGLFHIILAILGLGFLIFIHELGHYWIARRKGMKVEAFSIGFGKPLYVWNRHGVRWQLCILPFGGYVKIAGMQKEGSREPYEIRDGFYGKGPWERIQVALAGPLVNIGFAFAIFSLIWITGGREKDFAQVTHRIGWVDPTSALYQKGVRPGDLIEKYDGRDFHGIKDLLIASAMDGKQVSIDGTKIDYLTGNTTHFSYTLPTYENPYSTKKIKLSTIGVLSPAGYLIYDGDLPAGSPMTNTGIQPGDRIVWTDGEPIFSMQQLSAVVNESTAFLTVQRGDEVFQTKVPRVHLDDLKMNAWERGEIDDWQHEAGIKGRLQDLAFIPYNISPHCEVERRLDFIDEQDQIRAYERCQRCNFFNPLQENDKILAVDGERISTSYELLQQLQQRRALVIVQREGDLKTLVSPNTAEQEFQNFNSPAMRSLVASIGTDKPLSASGEFLLLAPIVPKPSAEFFRGQQLAEIKKKIEKIKDSQQREMQTKAFESEQKKAKLGLPLHDREVLDNPNPLIQFGNVLSETWRTLEGLLSGILSPKYVSGPIGIVTVMQQSWVYGVKEALFWMAVISLNLGIMNLLPIPVLDGGHIVFSLWEAVTKRRIKAKTMERLVIPFVGILIAFFLFVTYHDISRLFSKLF